MGEEEREAGSALWASAQSRRQERAVVSSPLEHSSFSFGIYSKADCFLHGAVGDRLCDAVAGQLLLCIRAPPRLGPRGGGQRDHNLPGVGVWGREEDRGVREEDMVCGRVVSLRLQTRDALLNNRPLN